MANAVLAAISLLAVDERVLDGAAAVGPPSLRTLDAIHIATALMLEDELDTLVTYDRRMQEAAEALGMVVVAPA